MHLGKKFLAEEIFYARFLASLALVAVLLLAPIALHADTLMTGQFVITGTVQIVGTTLMFDPGNLFTGTGTQTGTFVTLLGDHRGFDGGTANITYNPYTPDSAFFFIGPLTVTLDTLNETTVGSTLDFSGIANLAAAGFTDTLANYSFNTPPPESQHSPQPPSCRRPLLFLSPPPSASSELVRWALQDSPQGSFIP